MRKILILDDEKDILLIVQIILESENFKTHTISKWQDLSDSLKSFTPNLILLDISLDGADGRDVCERLKLNELTQNIPVLLMSGNYNAANNLQQCKADGFIAKPFSSKQLISKINSTIEKITHS